MKTVDRVIEKMNKQKGFHKIEHLNGYQFRAFNALCEIIDEDKQNTKPHCMRRIK